MNEFDREAATWDENLYRSERAGVVAEAICARVPVSAQTAAFEYGCGTGLLSFALRPHLGRIVLADSSPGMLAVVGEKILAGGFDCMSPLKVDLAADPLPQERFDLVYTLMTLHHITDTGRVLEAFFHLLEPGGYLCVADLDAEDGTFHGPGFTGHCGFDRQALGDAARAVGFRTAVFDTVFHTPRMVGGAVKKFPIFLMTVQK